MQTHRAMPILEVSDVDASVAYYQRLGFANGGVWGDPSNFAIVQRGDVTLGLRKRDGTIPVQEWWAAYIYVDDAKALHREFEAAGLDPAELKNPTDYGCIDFDIIDPDGHRLAFGQDLDPKFGAGLGPNKGAG